MKKNSMRLLAILTICFATISICFAQNPQGVRIPVSDIYKISADAGGVNLIEGGVSSVRKTGKTGLLIKGETVRVGDRVSTDSLGKAEILLNPGSYLRLAGNSEFEFTNSSLDDLQIKLTRGSAIMEVITNSDDGFVIGVETPQTKSFILESGIYRFDVVADGTSKVEVWKGKLQIGKDKSGIVKGGKVASVNNSQLAITKFDRDNKDEFEIWSKLRAKDLSQINASLDQRGMRNSLLSGLYSGAWNGYDTYGVWVFNYRTRTWCFMPRGYGFSSPYGFGLGRNIWDCGLTYQIVYSNPPVVTNSGTTSNVKPQVTRGDGRPIRTDSEERKPVGGGDRGGRQVPVGDVYKPERGGSRDGTPIFSPPSRGDSAPRSEPPASRPAVAPPQSKPDN
jgi:FecR protein